MHVHSVVLYSKMRHHLAHVLRCRLLLVLLLLGGYGTVSTTAQDVRVALVLTGGGARGMAQVGAIMQLERMGITPSIVVGSSIGAVVGGLYSAGYTGAELDSVMRTVDWDYVTSLVDDTKRETLFFSQKAEDDRSLLKLRFRDFSFLPPKSLGGSARFSTVLQSLLWNSPYNSTSNFDELRFRFRPVATDLAHGSWVALKSGNLATAIQASATFPLRYAPVTMDSAVLVDGGLVANIPIDAALQMSPDVVIVINTVSDYIPADKLQNALDVADQALMAAMKQRDSINLQRADVVVTPELAAITTFDFSQVPQSIEAGVEAVRQMAPRIQAVVQRARIRNRQLEETLTPEQSDSILKNSMILGIDVSAPPAIKQNRTIDSLITEMSGRSWSDHFARHWRWTLHRTLHEQGWPFAYIRAMAFDSTRNQLTVIIDPGRLQAVRIDKQRPVSYNDVVHEFSMSNGDAITIADLSRSVDRLRASELFADVDLALVPAADSGIDVLVGASDLGNQLLRVGARVDNERYLQGSIDFIHQNLANTGLRLSVHGLYSARTGGLSMNFEMPRIMNSLWTASLRPYYSVRHVWIYQNDQTNARTDVTRNRVNEYSEDRIGVTLSAGRQLERNGVILAELRYEEQRYRDLDAIPAPEFQPLTTVRGVIRWDDRDRIDFASRGRVIDLVFESSVLQYSNGISFTKVYAKLGSVIPMGKFALLPSMFVGAADKTLPGAELFSLGGQDLFFGMRQDEERGRQIALGNLAVRYRLPIDIIFPTYLSLRYDLGAVWAVPEQIKFAAFQHGIGATIGLDTPIGPARFSLGQRFRFLENPTSVATADPMLYFAIGVRL